MNKLVLTTAVIFAAMPAVVPDATAAPEDTTPPPAQIVNSELSGGDLTFFNGTARQTALIAALSDLAKTRAVTPEVQAVAAEVGKDQESAAARLKALASRKDVPLPQEPGAQGKKQLQTLAKLKGPKFDKSYLDALADAQDTLEPSLNAGATSSDHEISALAQASLATLKQERDRVRKLGM